MCLLFVVKWIDEALVPRLAIRNAAILHLSTHFFVFFKKSFFTLFSSTKISRYRLMTANYRLN